MNTMRPIEVHLNPHSYPHPLTTFSNSAIAMEPTALAWLGAGLGAGLITLGAGLGIGKLAGPAMEGTARQPEATDDIRTTMIIAAALIEGVAFFGLVIAFFLVLKG